MLRKQLIDYHRKRMIPRQFSWVDHNLVRKGYTRKCSTEALGLYLFLISVSDSEGLSYYSDRSISREINCKEESIPAMRKELIKAELLAYCNRIYQVLDITGSNVIPEKNKKPAPGRKVSEILEEMFAEEEK